MLNSVASGNKTSFRQLYDLFSDKVYNTALSYIQSAEDAEEITQDVFTNIFRKASNFKGDASVSTWIYRITVNTSLNYLKKNKKTNIICSWRGPSGKT